MILSYKVIAIAARTPNALACDSGRTMLTIHMKQTKLTSKQKGQEAEILEKTAIELIQKSVELKRANHSRNLEKKALKRNAA